MGTRHGQLFRLRLQPGESTLIQFGQIAPDMPQGGARSRSSRQNDLGIAQVEYPFLTCALEHFLRQRQMTPPGRDGRT
ncbi:hypothetical protein D3C80_1801840 [compost metagenome]